MVGNLVLNFLLGYFVVTMPIFMWFIFKILIYTYENKRK